MSSKLPSEILLKVFGYLDFLELSKVKATCKLWKDLVEYYKKKILPAMVPKVLKSSFLIARNDFKFEMIGPTNLKLPPILPEVYSIGFANLLYTMQNDLLLCYAKTCRIMENGAWLTHSTLNVMHTFAVYVSMEDGLYVFGGDDHATHDSVELLPNQSKEWQLLETRIPAAYLSSSVDSRRFGLAVSRSEILLMGGFEFLIFGRALSKILKFDTVNLEWTYVGDLLEGRCDASAVLFKNKIIIAGGCNKLIDHDGMKSTEIIDLYKIQNAGRFFKS